MKLLFQQSVQMLNSKNMALKKDPPIPNPNLPKEADTLLFDTVEKMIHSAIKEMKEFSTKKPNEIISLSKATSLNKLCEPIKRIVKKEPSAEFLELINIENLPSYSDTILILSNYETAMKQFRGNYFGYNKKDETVWFTKEKPGVTDNYSRQACKDYYEDNF